MLVGQFVRPRRHPPSCVAHAVRRGVSKRHNLAAVAVAFTDAEPESDRVLQQHCYSEHEHEPDSDVLRDADTFPNSYLEPDADKQSNFIWHGDGDADTDHQCGTNAERHCD